MTQGKCLHPWNKGKKGTFIKGHLNVNKEKKGCFKKGNKISNELKEKNKILGIKRYEEGNHPLLIKNLLSHKMANKEKWYGIGKNPWKTLSKKIMMRDNLTCQSCGLNKTKLNVHHIIPYSISKNNNEENLVTLCVPCHTSIEYYTQLQYGGNNHEEANPCEYKEGNKQVTFRS